MVVKPAFQHQWLVMACLTASILTIAAYQVDAQVYMVEDINPGWGSMGTFDAAALGASILFSADDGTLGSELWISDGTAPGTEILKDIWLPTTPDGSGYFSSSPRNFTTVGDQVFFCATPGTTANERLYVSDGTGPGTVMLDIYPICSGWASMGGWLYFLGWDSSSGWEIRKTDGETVSLLKEIGPGSSQGVGSEIVTVDFTLYGERLLFHTSDATNGLEPWISDGSETGTGPLKDIVPGTGNSSPQFITPFGGRAFFSAQDATGDRELWVTDGSESGTVRLLDINSTGSSNPHTFMPTTDLLYFVAEDGVHGAELWVSDGTAEGTQLVEDLFDEGGMTTQITDFAFLDGILYFDLWHPDSGSRLWVSDGTSGGTHLFFDIDPEEPGGEADVNSTFDFLVASDLLFFTAVDSSSLQRLWVSDGTTDGTHPVAPMSSPTGKTLAGTRLFFRADQTPYSYELHALPLPDIVTAPDQPTGEATSNTGVAQTYSTGGSVSLNGNRVQYRFHFGDEGSSDWLDYGVTSADYAWTSEGEHLVTAEARAETTGTTSSESQSLWVQVTFEEIIFDLTLTGQTVGGPGIEYTYTLEGGSNSDHALEYSFDWNDGTEIVWSSFNTQAGSVQAAHTWQNLGEYEILAKIRCTDHPDDAINETTLHLTLSEEYIDSASLTGPANGYTGQTYTYTISGESSWGHALEYAVDWGDGSGIDWTPFPPGSNTVSVEHAWDFVPGDHFNVWAGVQCIEHFEDGVGNGDDMTVAIVAAPAGLLFADGFESGDQTQW